MATRSIAAETPRSSNWSGSDEAQFELIAQGPMPVQRWRQEVSPGGPFYLGRLPTSDFPVPWDSAISRRHLEIHATEEGLELRLCSDAANPVFIDGKPLAEQPSTLSSGIFAIGETTFHVRPIQTLRQDRTPVEHTTFEPGLLRAVPFDDADRRIEVLTRLPDVILGAMSDDELRDRLIDLSLTGIPRADAVAIVSGTEPSEVAVLRQDRRRALEGRFRPSTHLVAEALTRGRSVVHVWDVENEREQLFTAAAEFDWAFCTPLPALDGTALGLYVTGRLDATFFLSGEELRPQAASVLQADVKFAELVADILRSLLRLNNLERQTAGLRQFLAPPILKALGEGFDAKLLEPRQCEATVLFCDLRGFSAKAEEAASNLLGLLERVSQALGVMTESILAYGGVTGDFLGDAALGFWGWPFRSDEAPLDACRAALAISRQFAEASRSDHPLRDFRVGIGIAHGPAVAGKIGTRDQVKFTVFGPVVNLASRLEGMTKQLRVPILLDEATAQIVRERLPREQGRTRRLARVLPYGSERPLTVSELLAPQSERPELSDQDLETHESAVEAFTDGNWDNAYRLLHRLPPDDRAPDFLNQLITAHNRVAPADWDGIIKLPTK